MRKMLLFGGLVACLAAIVGAFGAGGALAYGHADGPMAQVEISFNCTNATVCPPIIGDTGGVWIWAEVDSGGNLDYTLSGCGHVVGGGGPGSAGGGGSPGTGSWQEFDSLDSAFQTYGDNLIPAAVAVDGNGNLLDVHYYVLTMTDPHFGEVDVAVPVPFGHYNVSFIQYTLGHSVPGVATQTQVAP